VICSQTHIIIWLGGGNKFSQLFNVFGVNDVRQTEIRTAEPPVPETSASEFESAIKKSHKSPGTDQTPAQLIKA